MLRKPISPCKKGGETGGKSLVRISSLVVSPNLPASQPSLVSRPPSKMHAPFPNPIVRANGTCQPPSHSSALSIVPSTGPVHMHFCTVLANIFAPEVCAESQVLKQVNIFQCSLCILLICLKKWPIFHKSLHENIAIGL